MELWLTKRAALTPQAPALLLNGASTSFSALDAFVSETALRLRSAGVCEGDFVASLLGNGLPFVALLHAVARCGAVLLPLNLRLTPPELAFQLQEAQPRLLLHETGGLAERAREASALAHVQHLRVLDWETFSQLPIEDASTPSGAPPLRETLDLEDLCCVVFTSGTSGQPKGVCLPFRSFLWSAIGSSFHLSAASCERWLACLPLFHVGGLAVLFRSVLSGMSVVLHERFDPLEVNRALDEEAVSGVSLVSTMLARLLDVRGTRPAPSTLRCVLLGGGPTPPPLLERAAALGFPVLPTYGLTEAASQVATLPLSDTGKRYDVAGAPLFFNELRIAGPDGQVLPADVVGEIWVRGPTLMAGYLQRPTETAAALRDGWLHTGDLGSLDAAGYLRVFDRRSDLILSGGENVSPAEIEAILLAHPDVTDAGVAGVSDPDYGQRPAAWIVLRPGSLLSDTDLRTFCRARLAGYKIPCRFTFVDTLPRNAAGKLLRRELRLSRTAR